MARLTFEIEGVKVLSRNLRVLADDVVSMKPEFEEIGKIIVEGAQKNFENQGTEEGKWQSLSSSTLEARRKRSGYYKNPPGGQVGILQWTGNLKNSFTKETGDLYALVWNSAEYFKFHQQKNGRKGPLPRRVILDMSNSVRLKVVNTIWRGINKRVWNFWKQY